MADENKDATADSSTASEAGNPGKGTDDMGVPWENRAKEYERKYGDLKTELDQVKAYIAQNVQPRQEPTPTPSDEEKLKTEQLQALAANPKAYVEQLVQQERFRAEAELAAEWVRSQDGYKPDYEVGLLQVIRDNNLGGSPKQKVRTAWKIFKTDNPDSFKTERSIQENARDKEIQKYRMAGPGRVGPIKQSDNRKELLDKLRKAVATGNLQQQAELTGQLTDNYHEEKDR